jgi:C-terminal processing protease CtpA/Prc
MRKSLLLTSALFCGLLQAQVTPEQRVQDLQDIAALYAKRYAPYEWKRDAVGFDLYNLGPWLDRARRAKDCLEFYEIALEYVAGLQDTHSSYRVPSSFAADLGIIVDIYDGKTLIEAINRSYLPQARFPFQVGDEVVSVDGRTSDELITEFSRFRRWGSPLTTRRDAADLVTYRPQGVIPRAVELGDSATVVIRRASGDVETYTVPWTKTGVPMMKIGPVPTPKSGLRRAAAAAGETGEVPDYMKPLVEMRNWSVPPESHLLQGTWVSDGTGEEMPRRYLLGVGLRNPAFRAGLPSGFTVRLGGSSADFHFSGVYEAEGKKIGLLRIPSFSPSNMATAIRELDTEIAWFQKNVDGLVIDVMRNPGGGCYMADAAARLIPRPFYFFGELIRPTISRINSLQSAIESAKRARADQWIIDTYQFQLDQISQAYWENRGLTGSIPACSQYMSGLPASLEQSPAATVFTKPLIILVDEFSISAADIFPSMMQDNGRGVLVGMRTSGGGGSVSSYYAGFYSEGTASNTNSLVVRKQPIVTDEYPTAPFVENIGARPDIKLDYMKRENLMDGGQTFVSEFTRIMLDQIASGGR